MAEPSSLRRARHPSPYAWQNPSERGLRYSTRILLALIASELVLLLLFNLPLPYRPFGIPIGWRIAADAETLTLQELGLEYLAHAAPPPTAPAVQVDETPAPDEDGEEDGTGSEEAQPELQPEARRSNPTVLRAAVLDFSEEMPEIVGGLGAYYINIEYPVAARQAGIQGRLTLEFTVEPSGQPTDIEVTRSLHPLLDSAAVRALRQTRFVPGRHDGELVRVRMRLPVRFELLDKEPGSSATRREYPGADSAPLTRHR